MMELCSYCQLEKDTLWGTPYLADLGFVPPNRMCRDCWNWSNEASGGEIGVFPPDRKHTPPAEREG